MNSLVYMYCFNRKKQTSTFGTNVMVDAAKKIR